MISVFKMPEVKFLVVGSAAGVYPLPKYVLPGEMLTIFVQYHLAPVFL